MYTCAYKGHVAYKGRVVTNQVHLMIACQHPLLTFIMGKSNKIYINIYLYNSFFLFILYIHILLYFPYVSKKKYKKEKKIEKKKN